MVSPKQLNINSSLGHYNVYDLSNVWTFNYSLNIGGEHYYCKLVIRLLVLTLLMSKLRSDAFRVSR